MILDYGNHKIERGECMRLAYLGPVSKISNELNLKPIEDELSVLPDVEVIISYRYRHIISKHCLDDFQGRIINIHTSLLPWQRGAHPIFWGFIENTQHGVTIHEIDKGIDTGDIIAQLPVYAPTTTTFKVAWHILNDAAVDFFIALWPNLLSVKPQSQNKGIGSIHYISDLDKYLGLDWDCNIYEFIGSLS